ncbi:related to non-canonical ubiquitin conjugating enzyme 1 [Cephalotrichum gorgonifer]|uniref:Related to non-canonical ubiquitin conjugating enzyme 1 n=1 Tax=Cephalotrichum gorgonifer TaxID=2041049 RepID=A0AAE8SS87_9PEZI|nr:related to non-canonical ubiquitin conjugating enzyme 1 [Cephalotrichum gorgonifer]
MASAKLNTKSPTMRRILKEAQELANSPSPDYTASPLETDLFEWHFTFRGPPNSVYSEGIYHGRIVLPPAYPLRPPSFRFSTPSGRFEANREICLSISGHHEETWQPAWGVRTALVALRSFMETDPKGQLGGLETPDATRKRLALESHAFRCHACGRTNKEIIQECEELAAAHGATSSDSAEVEIPSDLKLGWKDEMNGTAVMEHEKPEPGAQAGLDIESSQLAEGFVQTTPTVNSPAPATTTPVAQPPRAAAARPVMTRQRQQPVRANGGVPSWLDQLIIVLFVVLIAAVLHRVVSS